MERKIDTAPEEDRAPRPVARVTGLYRGTFAGLVPLTVKTPLTPDQVRRNPIFYELDLNHEYADENLIIDLVYDNLSPRRLPDLFRGTDIPRASGSGRTGLPSRPMTRCTTSTAAGYIPERPASTPCRSGLPAGSLHR